MDGLHMPHAYIYIVMVERSVRIRGRDLAMKGMLRRC